MCNKKSKIVILYHHGLGNQMFQYALKRALTIKKYQTTDFIDLYESHKQFMEGESFKLSSIFKNIKLNIINQDLGKLRIVEPIDKPGIYSPSILNLHENEIITLEGFWQTEKYFKDIRKDLLKQFKFTYLERKLKHFGKQLSKSKTPTVALHIRRGDYLKLGCFNNICTKQYYDNAINYMRKQLGSNVQFIVFSDDIEWCKKNYPDFLYIEKEQFKNYQDWYDMYLMTKCQHNIIANSSFSWWGAWLNQNKKQIVLAPDKWLNGYDTPDIWCEHWIKLKTK